MNDLTSFGETAKRALAAACEGRYEETREILIYSDTNRYPEEVSGLAEAMGLALVKLEAREMGLEQAAEELREKNCELQKLLRQRREFSLLFILFAIFIGLYTFFSAYLYQPGLYSPGELQWMRPASGAVFAVVLLFLAVITIRHSGLSIRYFGLTSRNLMLSLRESLIYTGIVAASMTLLKWYLIRNAAAFADRPLIEWSHVDLFFWLYILIAPAQEFVARGVVQGSIQRLLGGQNAPFWAVLLASILFSVTHTHYSFHLSVISLICSFLWGWLYTRHETIIGISLSHFILGNYFLLLGFMPFVL